MVQLVSSLAGGLSTAAGLWDTPQPPPQQLHSPLSRVCVWGGLQMDGEAMKEHFAQYGAVASTKVVQTNQSGRLVSKATS